MKIELSPLIVYPLSLIYLVILLLFVPYDFVKHCLISTLDEAGTFIAILFFMKRKL